MTLSLLCLISLFALNPTHLFPHTHPVHLADSNAGSINGRIVECSGLDSGGGGSGGGGGGSSDNVVVGGGGGGGSGGGGVMQTNSAQVTTTPSAAFGDEDNSCDSHTRWGKK